MSTILNHHLSKMAYAINIRSDNDSSDGIRLLWDQASVLEETPSLEALAYPPHLTLAIYDIADPAQLFDALDSVFSAPRVLNLYFESIGYFETPDSIVLWAASIITIPNR